MTANTLVPSFYKQLADPHDIKAAVQHIFFPRKVFTTIKFNSDNEVLLDLNF